MTRLKLLLAVGLVLLTGLVSLGVWWFVTPATAPSELIRAEKLMEKLTTDYLASTGHLAATTKTKWSFKHPNGPFERSIDAEVMLLEATEPDVDLELVSDGLEKLVSQLVTVKGSVTESSTADEICRVIEYEAKTTSGTFRYRIILLPPKEVITTTEDDVVESKRVERWATISIEIVELPKP